ncbi:hypothetical protein HDU98_012172 [Podochytrium sp. JEL0797]|nr:hypothetical protein HDU98_012172 [Podochytrium sp. JEL0797]
MFPLAARTLSHPIDTTKPSILSTFRTILRQINKQYTIRNQNTIWKQTAISQYRQHQHLAPSPSLSSTAASLSPVHQLQLNALDLVAFLQSKAEHKRLVEEYWPASQLTETEKLSRTAGMVGLSMPKKLTEEETRAGGGRTWTEIQAEEKGRK